MRRWGGAQGRLDEGAGARGGLKRELEGRAEALAGTFKAQDVANMLWAACVLAPLCAPEQVRRLLQCLLHTVVHRLVTLGKGACFNTAQLW